MRYTEFPTPWARTKTERNETWPVFCHGIANAREYPDKASCPYISLAVYGDTPNESGCLRYADNIQCVTGIEGDYDAGVVSIDEAADRARRYGVTACFFTSASHRADAPRWRVLVPLGRECPLSDRAMYIDRLNGVLGGILTPESWTPSQAFLFGRVHGVEYRCICV